MPAMPNTTEILKRIEAALPRMQWRLLTHPLPPDTRAYEGSTPTADPIDREQWMVMVVDYRHPDRGPLDHTRSYDGTATNLGAALVVHLTPELAEKAAKLAAEHLKGKT